MTEVFSRNEDFCMRIAEDVEVLMNESLQTVKGGGEPSRACACCRMENNGGGQTTEQELD